MKQKQYLDVDKIYKQLDIHNEGRNIRTSVNTGTIFNDDGKRGKDYCVSPQSDMSSVYKMIK